ncbi:sugar porter family MFS transporter [Streptomyces sp. NPDC006134]|uniref:sugar porter family MFS transporter n=1 Tax=Streptomyces sp. NPDC006134 TaxID=3154467 RepID=UPI0034040515
MPETTTVAAPAAHERVRQPAQVYAVAAVSALGGLLFGYDTGIISGALLYLREDLHLSSRGQEIVVSVILVGAMTGALVSGRLAGRLGRRRVVLWVAVIFAVGALGAAVAPDTSTLIAARLVLGLAVGGASNMVPVYIAEVAPPAIRGRLMVLFQLMVAIGQLIAYLCGWLLAGSGGWRVMFGLAVIPAAVLAVGMTRLPESPRWLVEQGHTTAAHAVLSRLRLQGADIGGEIAAIREISAATPRQDGRALLQPWLRPALVVALGVAAFSQLTGINAIVYYAPTILSDAGFGQSVALVTGIGIGTMLVVAGITGALAVDAIGRRRTMLWFIPLSGLSMAVLGLAFLMDSSPAQHWIVVIALFAYILCNGIGMQSVVWLIAPEILPLSVRGPATSLATLTVWGFDLLIAVTALSLISAVGRSGTFFLYAALNVLCVLFVALKVPETRNRPLEDIERALRAPGSLRRNLADPH